MKSTVIKTAKDAGKLLMKHYGKIKYIKEKDKKSYFTNVDLASEKIIISAIRKKFPDHNIISEESPPIDNKSEYTWYIDPLDGTHNYIRMLPLFGVSIALAYKGKVKLGCINLPLFNEIYIAEKGKGAFLNGKRIKVSNKKDLKKSFILTEVAFRYVPDNQTIVDKLKGKVYDIRALGSAVFDYIMVAKGSADAYITPHTNSWDVAAGALIVEEASGKVTDFEDNEWNLKQHKFISSNKKIHSQLLKILK